LLKSREIAIIAFESRKEIRGMEDYMSFKQALRGFDRDEVLEYIRKQEEDFNARTIAMEREIRKRDKIISDLKNRIVVKDEQVNRLEREIRGKYQKYIDNYRQIGDLVYESKLKGQRIMDEAHAEASRIIAGAGAEAKKRVLSDQG
jgi:cell division septum initiation protein DivIVA